jgi:hypothetical protein
MSTWIIIGAMLVLALVLSFYLNSARYNRKLDALFPKYDKLAALGQSPVIITDSFTPYILTGAPPNLRTGALMWSEDGRIRAYSTATRERYDRAKTIWGDGPPVFHKN